MPSAHARRTLRYKSTVKILPPSLRQTKKGKDGRLLSRPQQAHPAATVDDFLTAVLMLKQVSSDNTPRLNDQQPATSSVAHR